MAKYKNVLLAGASGLLGSAVMAELNKRNYKVLAPDSDEFNLTDQELVLEYLRHNWPDIIINCCAVSDVDENEMETEIMSELVNEYGALVLGCITRDMGMRLIHFSTSYVFDGARKEPYTETDRPSPINRYGRYKMAGERTVMAENPEALIIRSSWLFGPGRTNFVSMTARKAQLGEAVEASKGIVASPTYSFDLAYATVELMEKDASGVVHVVNKGSVSRYDLAKSVLKQLELKATLQAVPLDLAYMAKRPANTVLSTELLEAKYGILMRPWEEALAEYIECYKTSDILLEEDTSEPAPE